MVATQVVSVMPQTCVKGAPSDNNFWIRACTPLSKGAAPHGLEERARVRELVHEHGDRDGRDEAQVCDVVFLECV